MFLLSGLLSASAWYALALPCSSPSLYNPSSVALTFLCIQLFDVYARVKCAHTALKSSKEASEDVSELVGLAMKLLLDSKELVRTSKFRFEGVESLHDVCKTGCVRYNMSDIEKTNEAMMKVDEKQKSMEEEDLEEGELEDETVLDIVRLTSITHTHSLSLSLSLSLKPCSHPVLLLSDLSFS